MLIKKIIVKTGTTYPEGLSDEVLENATKQFTFFYTPFTRISRLIRKGCEICNCDYGWATNVWRFSVMQGEKFFFLEPDAYLWRMLKHLGCDKYIYLEYTIGIPGGGEVARQSGIRYFYHTKELRHLPHIHAEYQGDELSIEILTFKVKGKFKNRKKQNEAVLYVKRNRDDLLAMYNESTNGIRIVTFEIADGEKTEFTGW